MTRPLSDWRQYPTLRVSEAAGLVGVCVRTFEREIMPHVKTRSVGRTRLVLTDSLRAWIGEDVEAETTAAPIAAAARRDAARMLRRLG